MGRGGPEGSALRGLRPRCCPGPLRRGSVGAGLASLHLPSPGAVCLSVRAPPPPPPSRGLAAPRAGRLRGRPPPAVLGCEEKFGERGPGRGREGDRQTDRWTSGSKVGQIDAARRRGEAEGGRGRAGGPPGEVGVTPGGGAAGRGGRERRAAPVPPSWTRGAGGCAAACGALVAELWGVPAVALPLAAVGGTQGWAALQARVSLRCGIAVLGGCGHLEILTGQHRVILRARGFARFLEWEKRFFFF